MEEWRPVKLAPSYVCNSQGVVMRNDKVVKHQTKSYRLCENGQYIFITIAKILETSWAFDWIKDLDDDEECKQVYGHPRHYITTKGRVYSIDSAIWYKPDNSYYQAYKLDGTRHNMSTLVGRTFLPDYEDGLVIMHIDEELTPPELNSLSNLKVGTHKDNTDDMIAKGRNATFVTNEVEKAFSEFCDKYDKLVWYARSPVKQVIHKVYEGTPDAIIQGALNSQSRVEEMYPDEIDRLRSESGDWEHGFNSGCLATMRYVLTSLYPETFPDEESDDPDATITYGGLEDALEEFPMLDT